jgi:hypothetical protein
MFRNAKNLIRIYLDPKPAFNLVGWLAMIAVILGLGLATEAFASAPAKNQPAAAKFSKIPLSFEANQGQTDSQVKFLSRGDGYSLFLTSNSAVLKLRAPKDANAGAAVIRMEMLNTHRAAQVTGTDKLPGAVNYFIGNDPKRWHSDIETYAKVKYQGIYPGVDAVFYGNQRQFEYDFVVAPGANPIRLRSASAASSPPWMRTEMWR